ncbi:MAG TPA: hypothetical protein ENN72_04885 [Firmicutes bacterium]|nr:hypothetical protein [Bacillota bacterium]
MEVYMGRKTLFVLMLSFFVLWGCLEDPTTADLSPGTLTAEGWELFENAVFAYPIDQESLYCQAIEKFELAIYMDPQAGNAYNGLGWSYMRISLEADAILNFYRGLSRSAGEVKREIAIGLGSLLLQENSLEKAQNGAQLLHMAVFGDGSTFAPLDTGSVIWHFIHDPAISAGDVHLNLAMAYIYIHRNSPDPVAVLGTSDDPANADTAWGQYYMGASLLPPGDERAESVYNILIQIEDL